MLYAALHSGGIAIRVGLLAGASGCFVLWLRSKRQLDAFVAVAEVREQSPTSFASEPKPQLQIPVEAGTYFSRCRYDIHGLFTFTGVVFICNVTKLMVGCCVPTVRWRITATDHKLMIV